MKRGAVQRPATSAARKTNAVKKRAALPGSRSARAQAAGGVTAVLGFYIQLLTTFGLVALAGETRIDETHGDSLLRAVHEGGGVLPESFGQDIAVPARTDGAAAALVQLKWSRTPQRHLIQPRELKEICEALADAAHLAGGQRVTVPPGADPFVLVTNRDLSPVAHKQWQAALRGGPRPPGKHKWNPRAWAVLGALRIDNSVGTAGIEAASAAFDRYSATLGADPHEAEAARQRLLGLLQERIARGTMRRDDRR
jgi:hypothetical protein